MSQITLSTTFVCPYDFNKLPFFPPALDPLFQDLSILAKQHGQDFTNKIPVVGIGGCPGVGKTTITNLLAQRFEIEGINYTIVRFDDWTNPEGIRQNGYFNLEGVHEFFKAFLEGHSRIEKPIVNEFTEEHSREVLDLTQVDIILFEGLVTISGKEPSMNYSQYCDKRVFLSATESDISRWKRERPTAVQRTEEEFAEHMRAVFEFHNENIEPFKRDASWIVTKDTDHSYSLSTQ